jgi:hypothetical protein
VAEEFPAGSEPSAPSTSAPDTQAAPDAQHFRTGLGEQIRQQQQYAQNDALDHYIAQAFPGSWPNERQWLRMNAHHLQNPMLVHHAAGIALQRGVPRDSPEFLTFVGQLLDQHAAAQMQPAPAPAPPMPPIPAHTDIDVEKTEYDGEPESASVAVHSAPVSRDSGHYAASGEYEPGEGSRVTLNKAEREHAEAAGVSVEEYARQKLRMMKLKKAKVIKDE